jgi:hypothetical protein
MRGSIPSFPQYAFMVWCSAKKITGATLPLPLTFATLGRSVSQSGLRAPCGTHDHIFFKCVRCDRYGVRTHGLPSDEWTGLSVFVLTSLSLPSG